MSISIRIPEELRRYCDEQAAVTLECDDIGGLLRELACHYPDLALRVMDDDARLRSHLVVIQNDRILPREGLSEAPVCQGDELRIFTAVSGG
ncbi:MAG: MoaD/ThiS family protein [Deltaproteobacteria bacterium]|nr:MoaD/ThiS family protein [Deltaproteobacteria bacterium]